MDIITDKLVFVPRDAGFFSVFNFLIGSLSTNKHIYPFFNKNIFLKINRINQHFAYWTESNNCWFDYFEPIQYFDNDNTHNRDNTFIDYQITNGDIAAKEFKDPKTTAAMMQNKFYFDLWRKKTNTIYNKFIKFKSEIIDSVDKIKSTLDINNTIAVHFRHPVHSCESGRIYFRNYFDIIDKLDTDQNIFLCTDSELAILVFKNKYGDRLRYIPSIFRLDVDNILEWSYHLMNHKYINDVGVVDGKGYELHQHIINNTLDTRKNTIDLLTEVLCMSQCNHLVHQVSNMPLAISYMNPNIKMHLVKGS